MATVRVTLEDHRERFPDTGCAVVALSLYAHIFGAARGAYQLCRHGSSREASILSRAAVEALITLRYITDKDCHERAKRWAMYSALSQGEVLKRMPHLVESEEVRETVRRRADAVRAHFPGRFWAAGLGIGSLRHMATSVQMDWHYDAIYWMGSQATHSTAIGVDDRVRFTRAGQPAYAMGLSGRHVRPELAVACDVLIRGLMFLNQAFGAGMDEVVQRLTREFTEVFGIDPLLVPKSTDSSEDRA
jgi:hypothetical protein